MRSFLYFPVRLGLKICSLSWGWNVLLLVFALDIWSSICNSKTWQHIADHLSMRYVNCCIWCSGKKIAPKLEKLGTPVTPLWNCNFSIFCLSYPETNFLQNFKLQIYTAVRLCQINFSCMQLQTIKTKGKGWTSTWARRVLLRLRK